MVGEKIKVSLLFKNKFVENLLRYYLFNELLDLAEVVDNWREADVVIVGPNYLMSSYSEALKIIKEYKKKTLLVDFDFEEEELLILLHILPVKGIIYKDMEANKLRKCLQVVSRGEVWIKRTTFEKFLKKEISITSLTLKELTVIHYLLQGLTNKEIGKEMNVTEQTVKHHINSILKKIKKRNRVDIILSFYRFKKLIELMLKEESALAQT